MKIFYAVQATGNGHISRAIQLQPYLSQYGKVDFFLSGDNSNLDFNLPIFKKSKGCSLYYKKNGGLDYWKTFIKINPIRIIKEAHNLELNKYDVVINDFDLITSIACFFKNVKSVQFGHQASFQSKKTPRPKPKKMFGELILKYFGKATHYIGFHFECYDSFIFPPVIKKEFLDVIPVDLLHVTVYLPSSSNELLMSSFLKLPSITFHWFLKDIKETKIVDNIVYHPIEQNLFNQSLISCHGLITGGGFETPAEALYLNKKLICIPISNHYEQQCNAAALKKMGVDVIDSIESDFSSKINSWYYRQKKEISIKANNIPETLELLFSHFKK